MSDRDARRAALAALADIRLEPTSLVTYRSAGRILALGEETALARCDELPAELEIERIALGAGEVEVDGHLGAFLVRVADSAGNSTTHRGDAVLDLNAAPLISREMPPPGYFHAPPAEWQTIAIAEQLDGLAGEFEKPKYFAYDESICAHSVNGRAVCSRCIEACPAQAIRSIGERIDVDPNLCQGGGSCATVCPSGAIRYLYPTLRDNGKRLRAMLSAYRESGGRHAGVLFHPASLTPDTYIGEHDNLLPLEVEELASVGVDLCLSALAAGAAQVILLADDEVPASARVNLGRELGWLGTLLDALGLDAAQVALVDAGAALPLLESTTLPEPSSLDVPLQKRAAIYQAIDHLTASLRPAAQSVELPAPAPFGEVFVDAARCTLCMSCVGACPGKALQDGSNREVPEIFFVEANCLQCGACVQTCPEDAVTLEARWLFDREQRNRARALNTDTPFACISCGKLFAPTSVINKMLDKLAGHHMFGNQRALDRLKMCDNCRIADVVQDPEAMGGQFDPLKGFRE